MPIVSIICALTPSHAIGYQGQLLFYLPADLKHFKQITTGHTILMGRKTFESLPKGALPNRRNLVITRQGDYCAAGAEVCHSMEEALAACADDELVYVIGGESVYAEALPLAERMHLTLIHAEAEAADTYFPTYDAADWVTTDEANFAPDEKNQYAYTFVTLERKA